jgi:hypothetical protein
MSRAERVLHLWLPAFDRFDPAHPLHKRLVRADRLDDGARGYLDVLDGYFDCAADTGAVGHRLPLPAAALVREFLAGDAGDDVWLSADPAWVQPDINGVRLIACGQLQLDEADVQALAKTLAPAFDDAGLRLEPTTPDRWHLRLSPDSVLPRFATPEQALGEDLLQHLPEGPQGRRWRVLLNEVQVLLHQHPVQTQRSARGLSPVNSLWLWGGGSLPQRVRSDLVGVIGDDVLLAALAAQAGIAQQPRTHEHVAAAQAGWLIDLHDVPADRLGSDWWPWLDRLLRDHTVQVALTSGERWLYRPWHRWRFWRGTPA